MRTVDGSVQWGCPSARWMDADACAEREKGTAKPARSYMDGRLGSNRSFGVGAGQLWKKAYLLGDPHDGPRKSEVTRGRRKAKGR